MNKFKPGPVTRDNVQVGDVLTIDGKAAEATVVSNTAGWGLKVDTSDSCRIPFMYEELIRRGAMIVRRAA
jgi:hypothetical protein